jgi:hypothetical protein
VNSDILKELYLSASKHSQYQKLSPLVEALVPFYRFTQKIDRFEAERFEAISRYVDFKGCSLLDIGGNTGYFSFEALSNRSAKVIFYEGNRNHCEFVQAAVKILDLETVLKVENAYYDENTIVEETDVAFLLNVLHHIGDDFGEVSSASSCLAAATRVLQGLEKTSNIVVFQIGFNWKGDRKKPLFTNGTKSEMIDWVISVTKGYWNVEHILIAEPNLTGITYNPLNAENIRRDDNIGEFLNRPLFILRSLKNHPVDIVSDKGSV